MKNLSAFFALLFAFSMQMTAQVNNAPANFFDPEHNAVALRSDTALQLLVSEYVLAKSLTARMGRGCQVSNVYKSKLSNDTECLIFEGNYSGATKQRFSIAIVLIPDADGKFFYASNQARVCEKPGCTNCSISDGKCVGCCSDQAKGSTDPQGFISVPLLKVTTNID